MAYYLIEFRFHGKAKYIVKELAITIHSRFHIKTEQHPHITLVGPFYTNDEKKLIGDFNRLCIGTNLMHFVVEGYDFFEDTRIVFINVKVSKELDTFRWSLSQKLQPYCQLNSYDYNRDFNFHATIASHIPSHKFEHIKYFIKNQQGISFKHVMVRVTLLKDKFILREYDFFLRRPLVRSLAKNKQVYSQTLDLLKVYLQNKFNPEDYIGEPIRIKHQNLVDKIKNIFRKPKIFITSDLHLDHTNIIRLCKRPFLGIDEMNNTLVHNWNNTVSNKDTVYFIGDLAYGRGSNSTDYWLKRLKGKIIFIKGNHDKSDKLKLYDNYILECKGIKFFLTHEPDNVPQDWKGWAICGHKHNNSPEEFPFINKKTKRINVSVELTKYRPVDIEELIKKIKE